MRQFAGDLYRSPACCINLYLTGKDNLNMKDSSNLASTAAKHVQDLRMARHLTLPELSARIGVSWSTLYRIEVGQSELTLDAAARLCFALRIGLAEFIEPLIGRKVRQPTLRVTPLVPIDDRQTVLSFFLKIAMGQTVLTIPALDRLIQFMSKDEAFKYDIMTSLWCSLISKVYHFDTAKAADPARGLAFLLAEDDPAVLFKFNFTYPTDQIDLDILLTIYQNAGIIMYEDARAYLQRTYQAKQPVLKLRNKVEHHPLKTRELLPNRKTLLLEILDLNDQMATHDEILTLAWVGAEFEAGIPYVHYPYIRNNLALAQTLVILSRWLSHLQPTELPLVYSRLNKSDY